MLCYFNIGNHCPRLCTYNLKIFTRTRLTFIRIFKLRSNLRACNSDQTKLGTNYRKCTNIYVGVFDTVGKYYWIMLKNEDKKYF